MALILVLLVSGCLGFPSYDQRGGPAIAARIRAGNSPLVESVTYKPGDYLDPATIDIALRPGVTTAQARSLICDLAMPAVRAGAPPDSLGVSAWTGDAIIASDQDPCPPTP